MGKVGASVEVRDTSIRVKFTFDGTTYKLTLKLNGAPMAPTPANVKYARRLAVEIGDKIRHDVFSMAEYFPDDGSAAGPRTVAAQLKAWLAAQRLEDSTRKAYQSAVTFWAGTLGAKPLRSLKKLDIQTALNTRPLLSGKTVNNYLDVLRAAVQDAVDSKQLTSNPVTEVPRAKHQKPPPDPFTLAEAEAIIADMKAHYPEQVYNYVEAKFFTGVRSSESFGLRWQRVDLPSKYIQIAEAIVAKKQQDKTKTHQVRDIKLNTRALAAFTRQAKHTRITGEHVFQDPRYGTHWKDERAFRRSYWAPTLKRLGIRYRVPYNTRHTYATMMLMAGMNPAFCASQMGHSVEIFLSTYAKWAHGSRDDSEMQRFEDSLKVPGRSPKTEDSAGNSIKSTR
jgi:integrase